MPVPDYSAWLNEIWGWPQDCASSIPLVSTASNIIVGNNPPYTAADFFALQPSFGGSPVSVAGTLTGSAFAGSTVGLAVGNVIAPSANIADGTYIAQITDANNAVLSQPAAQNGSATLSVYIAPLVPLAVINAYIYAASNSIYIQRWFELWSVAMALYIAHFVELWMIAQSAPPGSTAAQVAQQGLALGITTSQSAGDVSYSQQPLAGLEAWGAWNLTIYGQQLITFAQVVGSGSMLIY